MLIKLRLHDVLNDKVSGCASNAKGVFAHQLPEGAAVSTLLKEVGLDSSSIGLVIINGRQAAKDYRLKDGDRVELFAPLSGG
jgi:sulfur carrier protein ThiS